MPLPVIGVSSPCAGGPSRWDRWVPVSLRNARLDPGRRGAAALVLVVVAAALAAGVGVWRDRPIAEPAPPWATVAAPLASAEPGGGEPGGGVPDTRQPGAPLVVSVAGKVRRPGLVRVPDGARVADAIAMAGGPRPRVDLTPLNLARRVADGEQIVVGVPVPPGAEPATGTPDGGAAGGPAGRGSATGAAGRVDLNRATLEQLDGLPGVGPVTAQRILDWRARNGRFTAIEQLREIEGIGERRFGRLRDQVTL